MNGVYILEELLSDGSKNKILLHKKAAIMLFSLRTKNFNLPQGKDNIF